MNDQQVTLDQLKAQMAGFVRERDWEKFHTPKNLSMALAVEAAELLEHFQWLTEQESQQLDAERLHAVADELADIQLYLLSLVNVLQLDLSRAVQNKLEKNARKYPKDLVYGKAYKYSHYQRDVKK